MVPNYKQDFNSLNTSSMRESIETTYQSWKIEDSRIRLSNQDQRFGNTIVKSIPIYEFRYTFALFFIIIEHEEIQHCRFIRIKSNQIQQVVSQPSLQSYMPNLLRTFSLSKPLRHKTSFISLHITICILFTLKYQFTTNRFSTFQ